MSKFKLLYPITVNDQDSLEVASQKVSNKNTLWVREFFTMETEPNRLISANDFVTEGVIYHSLTMEPRFITFGDKCTKYYSVKISSTMEQLLKNEDKVLAIEKRVAEIDNTSTAEQGKKHSQFIDSTAARFKG